MSFTDEDLKRLTEEMGTVDRERWIRGETKIAPIEALLARLEAAENVCKQVQMGKVIDWASFNAAYDVWRQEAGK